MTTTHSVACHRVPPGWRACCTSCHEDEDEGYDTLNIEHAEVAPGVLVLVRYCCTGRDRVVRRVDRLAARLGGSGRRS